MVAGGLVRRFPAKKETRFLASGCALHVQPAQSKSAGGRRFLPARVFAQRLMHDD